MAGLADHQVMRRYVRGQRPERPDLPDGGQMPDAMWSLTQACWAHVPSERLSSQEVFETMATIIGVPFILDHTEESDSESEYYAVGMYLSFYPPLSYLHP